MTRDSSMPRDPSLSGAPTGSRAAGRRVAAVCGVLVAAAWAAFWWLAVPRHEICSLTYPAPAGCGSGRVPVAALWTAVTAAFYGVLLLRPGSGWRTTAVLGLAVTTVWGWFSVLYA